ncbi:MAG TPA: cytochrome P450 [Myxococcota bacterium]|nr:cytochrome P450 [Myxococcota bacterium]
MEEREIGLASGRTRVVRDGAGRPFVWAHGFTSSIDGENRWGTDALFRGLPGLEVVRYDARGHGRSAPARDVDGQAWPALGRDLVELVGALGLAEPIAAGASMGTATSLYAALLDPGAFSALVLVVPPTAWETRKAQADLYRGGAELVEARGLDAYLAAARESFRARPLPGFTDAMQETMLADLRALGPERLALLLRGAAASDLPEPARLRALDLPALVIATRGDPGHPLSTAERLVELLPRAELVVVDDTSQLPSAREKLARFAASGAAAAPRGRGSSLGIDVYSPDRYANGAPYADFALLRRHDPVHWQPTPDGDGYWAVTKHADVVEVSRDPETYSSAKGFVVIEPLSEAQLGMMRFTLLGMDPPEHGRYRRMLLGSFTPRMVAALEPRVREISRGIMASAAKRGEVEFGEDMAGELPMQVIGELLGVPEADRAKLRAWAAQLTGSQDAEQNPGGAQAAPAASIEMAMYAIGLAQSRRGATAHDLTSVAVNAEIDGHVMTDAEFGGFFVQLATAGNDTTRNLLCSGVLLLLQNPESLAALRADPALIPGAVEEMLRCESPLHYFRRTAVRDTTLRGQAIRAGQRVALYYGSANYDEDVFRDAEKFDIRRAPNPHLSFGIGSHFCLGAALARLEARVFFEELLAAFPRLALAGEPRRQRSNLNNALKSLPLRLYSAA